jgi:hypothetical protein
MKCFLSLLRVLALALVMLAIVTAVTLRQAQARFDEVLGRFGQALAQLDRFSAHSAPRKLFVNGLELHIESLSTPLNVSDALDRFSGLCHSAADVALSEQVKRKLTPRPVDSQRSSVGTVREESDTEGYFGCLDVGVGQTSDGLLSRLIDLNRTMNLRSLGQLRYALARSHGKKTTLVVLWTEGDFKLRELFPKDRDAPGRDLQGVPRLAGTKRVLSAFEEALPYGFVAYRLAGPSPAAAMASYAGLLEADGWTVTRAKTGMMAAEKDGRRVLVQAREVRAGAVVLTLSDLG